MKLSNTPFIHETAIVKDCVLGRYTEVQERTKLSEVTLGDYSYIMEYGDVWCARIGKFANIASCVRINATNHPTWRATQHHFTYRAGDYFEGAENDNDFFEWRRANKVTVGHDVWIGHGATILPGITIGNGAAIGAGAVVSKNVEPYTIVGGVPAKPIRKRFSTDIIDSFEQMSWWDWSHEKLQTVLPDFQNLNAEEFVNKYK